MSDTIYIHENGTRRQATADETAYILATQNELAASHAAQQNAADAKIAAAESARAKLAKLGLTDDELEAFLGL